MNRAALLALLALGLPVAVVPTAASEETSAAWSPYQPEHWVPGPDRNGVPCKAVGTTCVSALADRLRTTSVELAHHGYHTRADLATAMSMAAMGIASGADLVCDVADHASAGEARDLAAWASQCPVARRLQAAAAPRLAAELGEEQRATQTAQDRLVADARATQRSDEDRERTAAAAQASAERADRTRREAAFQHDLAIFRASYPVRKALGDEVCHEVMGQIGEAGQVERVEGNLIQIRYQDPGTMYRASSDHLRLVAYDHVGLCKFARTRAIGLHNCEHALSFAVNAGSAAASMSGLGQALDFLNIQALSDPKMCESMQQWMDQTGIPDSLRQ